MIYYIMCKRKKAVTLLNYRLHTKLETSLVRSKPTMIIAPMTKCGKNYQPLQVH